MKELEEFIQKRDQAMADLDIDWVIENTNCKDRDVALITAHKVRYELTSLSDEERIKSGKWLKERGYKRWTMTDILPDGELPE